MKLTNKQIANYFASIKMSIRIGQGICRHITGFRNMDSDIRHMLHKILFDEFKSNMESFDQFHLTGYALTNHEIDDYLDFQGYFFTLGAGYKSRIQLLNLIINKYDKLGETAAH